ncbi:hypothetical protein POPA111323_05425 [Polynucleobacter paneuropaeus]|jgi:hypothetical protein
MSYNGIHSAGRGPSRPMNNIYGSYQLFILIAKNYNYDRIVIAKIDKPLKIRGFLVDELVLQQASEHPSGLLMDILTLG